MQARQSAMPPQSLMVLVQPCASKSGQAPGHPIDARLSSVAPPHTLSVPPQFLPIAARILVSAFVMAVCAFSSTAQVVKIFCLRRPSSHLLSALILESANFPESFTMDFWHLSTSACAAAANATDTAQASAMATAGRKAILMTE